ncbi:ATP-binding protein [Streptomyces sp. NPDC049954]|uniref:ATP-binding protein n=1 Tax=Streptomyces sp. NPDC049954 TaxID=3155779 RepID=UPI00341680A7
MWKSKQELRCPAVEESVPPARRAVRYCALGWGLDAGLADTAELLASELVTNAVLHADGADDCRVTCELSGAAFTVTVIDQGNGIPSMRREEAGEPEPGGRGLLLVDTLADEWGVRGAAPGKAVYFVLAVP